MNIYVATSTHNLRSAKTARRTIRRWGHTVTSTWMDSPAAGRTDGDLTPGERRQLATDCAFEVIDADVVVALWYPAVFGAVIELGLAIGAHKPIVLVGDWRESVFWSTGMTTIYRVAHVREVRAILTTLDHERYEVTFGRRSHHDYPPRRST